jgi:pyruvate dehydrogenase E1 component beta subunit
MKQSMTYRDALNAALTREMEEDPSVFVFGLDVPDHKRIFGSTAGLVEKFGPRRCFGSPLSEDAMTGVALGAALNGLRPVHVHIRVDFLLLAMNQIANMISSVRYMSGGRLRAPLVIRAIIGRGWGQGAQHSKTCHSFFSHLPGIKVVMPASPQDAYSLLRSSVRDDGPVIFLEHRWLYDAVGDVDLNETGTLGSARVRTEGSDVTIASVSWMTVEAERAREVLMRKHGVSLEVVDMRSIAPADFKTLTASVKKTGRCIVADYDWLPCGFSAEAAAEVSRECFGKLKTPVERLGFAPVPCPTTRPLENMFYPSAATVVRTVEKMMKLEPADLSGEVFYSWEERFRGPF